MMLTNRQHAAVAAAMLIFPAALMAEITSTPPVVIVPPKAISPSSGTHAYNYATPNLSFVWEQYPAVSTPEQPLPTHYLFCMEPAGVACTQANRLEEVLAADLPSVVLLGQNGLPIGYRYTFTPMIPDNRLDEPFDWSVVGCQPGSCEASKATEIVAATAELATGHLSGNVAMGEYSISAEASNAGLRISRPFFSRIVAWEVMGDETTGCLTNVDEIPASEAGRTYVIDDKGGVTQLSQIPQAAGHYVVTGTVVGMFQNSGPKSMDFASPGLPISMSSPVGVLAIAAPKSTVAIVSALYLDVDAEVYEADESNNGSAKCELVFGS